MSSGGRARAAVVAPGLDLGLGLAAGCGRGVLTGLGGCLAAVLGFGWVVGVGFVGAWACNRCIVVDLSCDCEACSLDAPGVVTPDTAPDISEPN